MCLVSSPLEFLPVVLNEGNILWYLCYTSISGFSYGSEIASKETGHLVWSCLCPHDVQRKHLACQCLL